MREREQFERYIVENQARFLEELSALCAVPSVAAHGTGLGETADLIEDRLRRLGASVCRTTVDGSPPIVYAELGSGGRTLLMYNHYDVQPADPLNEWSTPPFCLTQRDDHLYCRGVADDKGDLLCRLQAIEAYQATVGPLPLRVKILMEGEEEIGSPHLAAFAERYQHWLEADGCLWETGGKDAAGRFLLEFGVKGLCYLELTVRTAASDLHSSWGTIVPDAAWRLVWALDTLKDAAERILVDGLMERVRPVTAAERSLLEAIPFDEATVRADYGIGSFLLGLSGTDLLAKHLYEPTCTISGLKSGYIDQGQKTVLPSSAMAKVSFRLVPNLEPALVLDLVRGHLDRRGFTDVELRLLGGVMPARSPMDAPFVSACVEAARRTYGAPPILYPTSAGSGPLYDLCRGTPAAMAGIGHANSRIHAPNENVFLDDYLRGIQFVAELIDCFSGGG